MLELLEESMPRWQNWLPNLRSSRSYCPRRSPQVSGWAASDELGHSRAGQLPP